jgi:hypothetical protein
MFHRLKLRTAVGFGLKEKVKGQAAGAGRQRSIA